MKTFRASRTATCARHGTVPDGSIELAWGVWTGDLLTERAEAMRDVARSCNVRYSAGADNRNPSLHHS